MATIYSKSYHNSHYSSSDSHAGLFSCRWTKEGTSRYDGPKLFHSPIEIKRMEDVFVRLRLHLAHERFNKSESARDHVDDAPLLARAWAFQERLLPCHAVHFHAEKLVWESKSGIKCECMQFDQQQQHGQRERRGQRNDTGWLKDSLGRVSKTVGSFKSAG
jgi:hypothetical protein